MAGGPIDFWNAWAVQSLVLTSLTLQVALVLLAGIRRRGTSWRTFRFMLWLAYQLADATAIYALGHLSFDGATPREHRLVAFWAPFLLLHLGGPDNITAYSLEDNMLWLRHLLNLGLQVLGASYVLYKHYIGTQDMLLLAAILMFVVGVVKYGERTWALSRPSKRNSPLPGRFAMMLGFEEWWNREHHSQTARISEYLKEKLRHYIHKLVRNGEVSTQGIVRKKWGEYAIQSKCRKLYKKLTGNLLGVEFQEGIIIWHIATDLYLLDHKHTGMETMAMYESVRVLSNYMMFLLVERPYMLPGLAQSRLYRRTCENLVKIWGQEGQTHPAPSWRDMFRLRDGPNSRSSLQRRKKLADMVQEKKPKAGPETPRLSYAIDVAKELASNDENVDRESNSLQVLLFVWMDFLVHAANRCSRESHAKKLSSGGEFTTVLWLLIEHLHQLVEPKPPEDGDERKGTQRAPV
ncbi:hypothetical protein TRIUR3_14308 [Triticum urartu]|uniref:DUF4220 domain-containing protein n=1 Tax=Triticum urartu TaxID=4572 RepID=M8B0U0_TRIUA|nr:hypothetical protein TRIUR3_14308 [Triticum urartu]